MAYKQQSKKTQAITKATPKELQSKTQAGKQLPANATQSLKDLHEKLQLVEATFSLMTPEVDYGSIPGVKGKMIFKAGVETLRLGFNYTLDSEIVKEIEEDDYYFYRINTHVYDKDGRIIGNGMGSCSSKEGKYRWRWLQKWGLPKDLKELPTEEAADKWREIYGDNSVSFGKSATGQTYCKFRIENPDMADVANTVLKQAIKRSRADAILTTTGASRLFIMADDLEQVPIGGDLPTEPEEMQGVVVDGETGEVIQQPEAKAAPAQNTKRNGDDAIFEHALVEYCKKLGWTQIGGQLLAFLKEKFPGFDSPFGLSAREREEFINHLDVKSKERAEQKPMM